MTKPSTPAKKTKPPVKPAQVASPRSLSPKAKVSAKSEVSTSQTRTKLGTQPVRAKPSPLVKATQDVGVRDNVAAAFCGTTCLHATKQARLIALLSSTSGASMSQMMALTGWLPHTVRGMLSGSLRKRLGLDVQHKLVDGVRVFRIAEGSTP